MTKFVIEDFIYLPFLSHSDRPKLGIQANVCFGSRADIKIESIQGQI